ncbi:MAG TPA: carboxypeptidase-like regulatory domain-containing protein [bacterium]|nr:carboxypeptidase-like regulatory domain-containing protein [bacterium]
MRRPPRFAPVLVAVFAAAAACGPACTASRPAAESAVPGAAAGANGVIRGRVIDGTAPAHPVAGQPVRLQIVERGTSSERETRTDAAGAFIFAGLPVGGLRIFLVSTQYQGAPYEGAERIVLTQETPVRDLSIAVYDAGADRRALRGTLLFAVVDVVPGALRVTTVEQVQNATDRTVVTTSTDPLAFPLPRGAVAVQALDGWRDPRTEEGRITDARAIPPGVAQVTYAYQEQPRGGDAALAWAPPFGAARVEVLVADAHLRVAGDGMRAAAPVIASGRHYTHWSGGPVAPGATVALRITGLPAGGDWWPGLLAAALAAVLGLALVTALRRL